MASVYGSSGGGGGGCASGGTRQRRAAAEEELHHHQQQQHANHYMEDPDLDVSSIVTEFVPLEDPFVPYFDATAGEEMEGELCAPLEASFASSCGATVEERMYARFRPPPAGYPPNTSTPRFATESSPPRVEVPRGGYASGASPKRLEDALADLMDGMEARPTVQLVEASPSAAAAAHNYREPPPQLSLLEQFIQSISRLVNDAAYARTTNCFKAKIPREISEDALISFLTHFVRYPMRRPANTLLQARSSPIVLEQLLKTAMEPQTEEYEVTMTRDSYFRITLKNSVNSLGQLYQIVRGVVLSQRGYVDVTYSPVRGRIAFIGFNGNLPIRMSQPIATFIEAEQDARQRLNALFSAEITLSRAGDDARELYITYFDAFEANPRTGKQSRVTEVNMYHIIHPASSSSTMMPSSSSPTSMMMTSPCFPASTLPPPLMSATPPPHLAPPPHLMRGGAAAGGRVSFSNAPPKHYDVHVERPMLALAHLMEPTYTLGECFQLSRSYPQHKW